jgi:hypothetical protein
MKKALILQSNYIPWKGYFYAIKEVDVFVMYDDVQYTKNDWRNRNLIKSKSGLQWLTIPIETKNKSCQKINEAKIVNSFWANKHLLSIKHNYSRATYYKQYIPFFEDLYNSCKSNYLIDINRIFLTKICELLEIKTTIIHSSDYDLKSTNKTERIVEMCSKINVSDYYSGPAARAYIETDLFDRANINLHYFNYGNFPTYQQLYLPFLHEVSIIDVILNTGSDAKNYIEKNSMQNPFTQPVYQFR